MSQHLSWRSNAVIAMRRSVIQFRNNFLRTTLTLLGVVMGVAAVVAMMSIGEGAQREIVAEIEAMGAKSVHIVAKPVEDAELANIVNDSNGLSEFDASAIEQVAPGVEAVGYRMRHNAGTTDLLTPGHELVVYGVSAALMEAQSLEVGTGRGFADLDHSRGHRVAILGADLARREFGRAAIGRHFRIDDAYFQVVGILAPRSKGGTGRSSFGDAYGDAILLPYSTAYAELTTEPGYGALDMISVQVGSTSQTLPAKYVVNGLLEHLHGGVRDFDIISPEEVLRQKQKTQTIFNAVLIAIAAISLIVGGIGVMNIMLANVMERIGEIGLRRAVGARRRDIRNQFLAESVIICSAGGLLGVLLGFVGSYAASSLAGLPIAFAWEATLLAFFISMTVGVSFGLMPAVKAANTDPIDALRT